jgi:hypothetical protein
VSISSECCVCVCVLLLGRDLRVGLTPPEDSLLRVVPECDGAVDNEEALTQLGLLHHGGKMS